MALQVTTSQPPKGSITLSRSEAVAYQWNQIISWPVRSDVWSFFWGLGGLGILAGASATYINLHYRKKLKLRHFGHISTSLPMIVAPTMCATLLHTQIITNDLFLRDTKCPLCLQFRASAIQIGLAMVYPIILSPLSNFMFAIRHATYRIPRWDEGKANFKLWLELTRPLGKKLIVIALIHTLAASFVTYSEAENLYYMQNKLLRLQEEREMKKLNRSSESTLALTEKKHNLS